MLLDQRPGIAPHEFQSHKSPPEVQSVRTLRALCIGAMLQGVRASFALMTISLPTRDKPAKADFPRIQKSPLEVMELIKSDEHALTNLFYAESGWAPFFWKGTDCTAPFRALYIAESLGLLQKDESGRTKDIPITDITAAVNRWLMDRGQNPVAETTIYGNLKTAAMYVHTALGLSIIPIKKTMTVRLTDQKQNAANLEKYFAVAEKQLSRILNELQVAENHNWDTQQFLANVEQKTKLRISPAPSSN